MRTSNNLLEVLMTKAIKKRDRSPSEKTRTYPETRGVIFKEGEFKPVKPLKRQEMCDIPDLQR